MCGRFLWGLVRQGMKCKSKLVRGEMGEVERGRRGEESGRREERGRREGGREKRGEEETTQMISAKIIIFVYAFSC